MRNREITARARAPIPVLPPGPRHCGAPVGALPQALYACFPPALSSVVRGGLGVRADRRYHCRGCGIAVWVCGTCERGQSYCPGDCKEVRRGEQLRRAAVRYQRSRRGALNHAARQRRYRQRRRRERPAPAKRVTHHTFARVSAGGTVAGSPVTVVSESADDPETSEAMAPETCASAIAPPARLRCAFCHRPLGAPGPGVEGHAGGAASA